MTEDLRFCDMRLRIATGDDFNKLSHLFRSESARLSQLAPEIYRERAFDEPLFIAICEHKSSDILIAEDELGTPLGKAIVWATDTPKYPNIISRSIAYVTELSANADVSGEEVLAFLLDCADEWAGKHGCEVLELDVSVYDTDKLSLLRERGYSDSFVAVRRDVASCVEKLPEHRFAKLNNAINFGGAKAENEYFSPRMLED